MTPFELPSSVFRGLILLLLGGSFAASPTLAQQVPNTFLPAPRSLRQHLSRAEKALAEERFGDAIRELTAVLAEEPGPEAEQNDYFVAAAAEPGTQTSIKSEAQRMIGSMPRKGLELYELQFGATARSMLEDAIESNDFELLNNVVRSYFHTVAGYEATMLLGRVHLDRDQPLAAALCFQRVVESPAAKARYEPEASTLLATCWHYAGRSDRAVEALLEARRRFPDAELKIGGQPVTNPSASRPADALAWLNEHFNSPPRSRKGPAQWLVHRGDATRNSSSGGGMPLATLRWRSPTAESRADETLIREIQTANWHQGTSGVLSLSPLAVDDVILMRSPDRMLAINFHTGKRIWEYPWSSDSFTPLVTVGRGATRIQEADLRRDHLRQRLWQDNPYGQVSSDGRAVYLLDDLRLARKQTFQRLRRGSWTRRNNQLVALDLSREGSLKWMAGGETGFSEPKLAGAFFLGAPLPLMGRLYVLAELESEIRLVTLDADSGRQLWSQQLAHVESMPMMTNPRRRLAGASPSFADGVLVCPTSAGAVVAIELASRSLLWGYQYAPPTANGFPTLNRRPQNRSALTSPWIDTSVTIANGSVVLTPSETEQLFCLDLLTGQRNWEPATPRRHLPHPQYVACVHENAIVVVGKHGVLAFGLNDGQPAWEQPLQLDQQNGEMPSGRGFQSGDQYYLPTTAERLIQIDLATGEVVAQSPTQGVLGNLICYKDQVVSHSTDYLAAFYQIDPLRQVVEQRLNASADDTWALARRAELLINDGQLRPALASLRRAYELEPSDVSVRTLLVKTLLAALRNDFAEHQGVAIELEQLIDRPAQRLEYLRLMGAGLQSLAQFGEAAEHYFALADLIVAELDAEESVEAIPWVSSTESTSARLDRWLIARFAELFDRADDTVRAEITSRVEQRWQSIDGSTTALERFLALYGFHPLAEEALLKLALALAQENQWLGSEIAVSKLETLSASSAAMAAAKVADEASSRGEHEAAAQFYKLLAKRWPETIVDGSQTGQQLLEAAKKEQPSPELLAHHEWPYGQIKQSSSTQRSRVDSMVPVRLARASSTFDESRYSIGYHQKSGDAALRVRDGYGRLVADAAIPNPSTSGELNGYAEQRGHMLVALVKNNVVAVNLFAGSDDALLWNDRFASRGGQSQQDVASNNPLDSASPSLRPKRGSLGMLGAVTSRGVVYVKSRSLLCVDPLSGQRLWERQNVPRESEVFGDEEFVFLVAPEGTTAEVLSTIDGSHVGSRDVPRNRWATSGRRVLGWHVRDESIQVNLHDPWLQTDVWSQEVDRKSCGTVTSESVAILQPDGRFTVRSLNRDQTTVDTRLDPVSTLGGIHLLESADQLLLFADRTKQKPTRSRPRGIEPLGQARIYAFERATGNLGWQSPIEIENYGWLARQPAEAPTIWFLKAGSRANQGNKTQTQVVCLDRRDGRVIFEKNDVPWRSAVLYRFELDPTIHQVWLRMQTGSIRLQFTDEPQPPAPPARIRSK